MTLKETVRARIKARYLADFPDMAEETAEMHAVIATAPHGDAHLADMLAELDRQEQNG